MSRAEHDAMVAAGRVLPTVAGLEMKHVTAPPDSTANQAAPAGSVFVEFDMIDAQVSPGGNSGWLIVYGVNSMQGRPAVRRGQPVAGLPRVENVAITETRWMQGSWVASFQEWLKNNLTRMEHEHIRVLVVGMSAYSPSSIHADFFGERNEATVQLWEDGQSDFHWLDSEAAERDPEVGVVVTHHDFHAFREMEGELKRLVERLPPEQALAGSEQPRVVTDEGGHEVKR